MGKNMVKNFITDEFKETVRTLLNTALEVIGVIAVDQDISEMKAKEIISEYQRMADD